MAQQSILSQLDIKRLIEDQSSSAQIDIVGKLSAHFNAENEQALTHEQDELATEIFRLLLSRAEVQVRGMIAFNLRKSDKIPRVIACKMAHDEFEVALPIILHSNVLSDDDLLDLIKTANNQEKIVAIAKRDRISEKVSDALVDTRIIQVVYTLVQNKGANISERTYEKIIDHHAGSAIIMEVMLDQNTLPFPIVEKLVAQVASALKQALESKCHNLLELTAIRKKYNDSIEVKNPGFSDSETMDPELLRLINRLEKSGKMQPFSALCMANMQLFEVSLARIIRIPYPNVHQLMLSPNCFKALYTKAELPENMFEAVELCIHAMNALEKKARLKGEQPALTPAKVMDEMRHMSGGLPIEGLEHMLGMMQHFMRKTIN